MMFLIGVISGWIGLHFNYANKKLYIAGFNDNYKTIIRNRRIQWIAWTVWIVALLIMSV